MGKVIESGEYAQCKLDINQANPYHNHLPNDNGGRLDLWIRRDNGILITRNDSLLLKFGVTFNQGA